MAQGQTQPMQPAKMRQPTMNSTKPAATMQANAAMPTESGNIFKKWWFWLIIAVIIIGAGAAYYFFLR